MFGSSESGTKKS